ncbi:hypothetical protein C7M61_002663 [Candidozyma pseudohaemuli]|uniref:Vacuolar segregation protein 7 n=1 Tax=Candidozyma pseudohaemuli TaxID=418784 RepID=A0A2P7YRY9_9ASCO|nr:hypothetical protein C7M61_002663 [[Candida] pseudohaemulonii]PSK38724.1 hypothetical protein C7M61_002663 [[Candida] pseudohaemulonii]
MSLEKPLLSKNHRRLSISIPPNQGLGGEEASTKQAESTETKPKTGPQPESGVSSAVPGTPSVLTPQGQPPQAQSSFPQVSSGSGSQNSTGQGSLANHSSANVAEGPSVINKQLLSKLNKSLKEKQRIINNKTDSRNPALIQDIVTTLPQHATFPGNVSSEKAEKEKDDKADSGANDKGENGNDEHLHPPGHSRTETPLLGLPPVNGKLEQDTKTKTKKRIAKQNSTRTDFFAAKLASAVDDVDTSDSDETFVYENSNNDFDGSNGGGVAGPAILHPDDNDINKPPTGISLVQDNISAAASLRNPTPLGLIAHSPSVEARKELGDENTTNNQQQHTQLAPSAPPRAELIHSVQSSKWNLRSTVGTSNTTPPSTTALRGQPQQPNVMSVYGLGLGSNSDVHLYANPYIDQNKSTTHKAGRKSSSNSLVNHDKSSIHPHQSPRYAASNQNFGLSLNSPVAPSVNGDRYSFEDGIMGDEVSYQGDAALVCTDFNNTVTQNSESAKPEDHLASRSSDRNQRSSTTSLKLRSTTSKLFDKKGAQPRRYSIIPDDIDIEDFDDDLIYYDNNIRFPYNSQNGSHLNDTASLLNNNHHRMTHYRSLNLSNPGPRQQQLLNNKRYASMGFPSPTRNTRGPSQGNNIYPFPYLDQKYYFDPENYDEEANMESPDEIQSKSFFNGRNKLSPSNTHFRLPRKVSSDSMKGGHVRCLKSFVYTMVSILMILAIGFVLGFLLASTKDLSNLSIVGVEDALVSQDELLFNVVVEALNPGWFTISIEDIEIDIFAKSGYVQDPDPGVAKDSVETVLLGSVTSFETMLDFQGSFFQRDYQQQSGEIKLVAPGRNLTGSIDSAILQKSLGGYDETETPPDNSEKWEVIRKHPFDLILRGVLKYKLPLSSSEKSATVNKVSFIDPNTSQGLI